MPHTYRIFIYPHIVLLLLLYFIADDGVGTPLSVEWIRFHSREIDREKLTKRRLRRRRRDLAVALSSRRGLLRPHVSHRNVIYFILIFFLLYFVAACNTQNVPAKWLLVQQFS